jgi:signal transduction histidine kinase
MHTFWILLLWLLIVPDKASAQVRPAKSTHSEIDSLNELSRTRVYTNVRESILLAQTALEKSHKAGYKRGLAYAHRNLGSIYSAREQFLPAIDHLQRALWIFETLQDSAGIGNCFISLGHTYRRLGAREEEYHFHKRAFDLFSRLGNLERKGVAMHNLGETMFLLDSLPQAQKLTEESITILRTINARDVLSNAYKVSGQIALRKLNLLDAQTAFEKVLQLADSLGPDSQKPATVEALTSLATIAHIRGDSSTQLRYLTTAKKLCEEYQLAKRSIPVLEGLIRFYEDAKNEKESSFYRFELKQVQNSLAIQQQAEQAELIGQLLQSHALMRKYEQLEKETQQEKERTRIQLIVILFLILIVSGGVYFLTQRLRLLRKLREAVQELTASQAVIKQQNEHLERLNAEKTRFFRIVAHDLKAPLHSLMLFSSLSEVDLLKMPPEDLGKLLQDLNKSVSNTIRMADNLMTWAAQQMNEIQFQPANVQLAPIVTEILDVFNPIAHQKNITISVEIEPEVTVFADANQVSFILRNLINNAIKFTNRGGSVRVAAKKSDASGFIHISVSDTGIGISESKMKNLFLLGENRSTTGTNGEKGTGLGLMLVHDFVKRNGGTIEVSSTLGKGSVITVSLPSATSI